MSDAVCSNKMIYGYLASINWPFTDVLGYEVSAFVADTNYVNASTGQTPFSQIEKPIILSTHCRSEPMILVWERSWRTIRHLVPISRLLRVFQAFDLIYAIEAR